jgi:hypothetical protein
MEGVNLIKIYCKHIHKCHNISPLYNYYVLTIKNLKIRPQHFQNPTVRFPCLFPKNLSLQIFYWLNYWPRKLIQTITSSLTYKYCNHKHPLNIQWLQHHHVVLLLWLLAISSNFRLSYMLLEYQYSITLMLWK